MTTKQRWVLTLTSIGSLMVALDALVVTTALSSIRLHLGASIQQLEWTVNAYTLSFAVLMMTGSALGDRFGRRRLLAIGLALFSAASAACALAPSIGFLIAMRAVQGVGAAFVMPLSIALLTDAFPPERRAWAMGLFSGVTGLAVLGGPVVGGAITQGIAWSWIFWINVPIGVIVFSLVLTKVSESRGPQGSLDFRGLALVTGAALGIIWTLVRGNGSGWGSVEVLAAFAGGGLLLVAFVMWELRAGEPMLPMRLFASRQFSAGNAASFFQFGSLFGVVFFMAQFLQTAQGHSPLDTGVRLLPWTASLFVIAPLAGARLERFGSRPFIAVGLAMQACGFLWLALIIGPTVSYARLVPPLVLAGAGVSVAIPAAQTAVVNAVQPQFIGKASGTFSTMRQFGGAFGIAILVAVFTGSGSYASPGSFSDGFVAALGVGAALSLCGALSGLALPARRSARTQAAVPAAAAGS
jgi:EmrB/QacA subfamily drug resistance transporter